MRHRLRGRVKDELRRWVELAAARTEVALFQTHVENAVNFIELLEKELQPAEAVELYLDALEVRESVAELTYYSALGRIADHLLPESKRGATITARSTPTTRDPARPQRGVQLAEGS